MKPLQTFSKRSCLQFCSSFLVAMLMLISIQTHAAPTAKEYGTVLNLAGKQRMLTQKMSKEILLIYLKIDTEQNMENLSKTAKLFDETLEGLLNGNSKLGLPLTFDPEIRKQIEKVKLLWAQFYPAVEKVMVTGFVNDSQLKRIARTNLPLLKQMNKAVGMYEADAKKNGLKNSSGLATEINLAGKQRMLSQKMTKEYLLIKAGFEVAKNQNNLTASYDLFDRTLTGLVKGDSQLKLAGNPPKHIKDQLGVVESLWSEFMPLMANAADQSKTDVADETCAIVVASNLPLLKEMNKAVKLFEVESAK